MARVSLSSNVPVRSLAVQPETRTVVSGDDAVVALHRGEVLAARQKGALHATIHQATQPAKAIAEAAGLKYPTLANAALVSTDDQLPFRYVPLVLRASDNLALLQFYASLQGCEVFRLPRTGAAGDAHQAARAMREFAELLEAGAAAEEDRVITPEEFARIDRETDDVVRAALEYRAHYRARVQRPLLEGV